MKSKKMDITLDKKIGKEEVDSLTREIRKGLKEDVENEIEKGRKKWTVG